MKLSVMLTKHDIWLAIMGTSLGICLLYLNGGWSSFRSSHPMNFFEYYLINDIALLVIPLVVITLCGLSTSDYGLRSCSRKHLIAAAVIGVLFFPVVLITAKAPEFQAYYLQAMRASGAITNFPMEISAFGFVRHQIILMTYMFAWEWFFRGFLLMSVNRISGSLVAVLVQAVLFTVMHLGKPTIEVVSSFFGAVLLGMWALRSRSILPCFTVHALLTSLNDVAVLLHSR